jgi:hypothetical protein
MGLYLHTDADDQIPLASNTGWSEVGKWIESLGDKSPLVSQLWNDGWAEPAGELRDQLAAAVHESPPEGDAAKTVDELIESLKGISPESAVVVSDGFS